MLLHHTAEPIFRYFFEHGVDLGLNEVRLTQQSLTQVSLRQEIPKSPRAKDMLTLACFLMGIAVAALMLPENKTPACLPSSHFSVQGWACMDGENSDGEGRKSLVPTSLITCKFPIPRTSFLSPSLFISLFLLQDPDLLFILGSSALTMRFKKPRICGVSLSFDV